MGGFSLIEILVAITIVAVLGVLMITVVWRPARNSAHTAVCASNMRNLYLATLAFVEDHGGKLPPDRGHEGLRSVDDRYWWNQFWWGQAYVGRYALGQPGRSSSSSGKILQREAEIFNCPARFADGSDNAPNDPPRISYVMSKMYHDSNFYFHTFQNPNERLLLTEGIHSTIVPGNAVTGGMGERDSGRRLRRFHNGALNILYLSGRVELFSGEDEAIKGRFGEK